MSRKSRAQRTEEALYRYAVIAPLLPLQLSRTERRSRLEEILRCPPPCPPGMPRPKLSRRTIQRWLKTYREAEGDRLAALMPSARSDRGQPRKLPQDLLAKAISLRELAPRFSARSLLRRVDHPAREQVARRSLSRALREAGYDRRDKKARIEALKRGRPGRHDAADWDLFRWEADFPNEIWQVDSTPSIWLRRGAETDKPVRLELVNLIDDHSRLVVGGGFTERLRVVDLLRFLAPAITRYGVPNVLFMDQAKVHKSTIVVQGLARLGGSAVYGTVGHAPGHGKVEKLHQDQQNTLEEDLRLSPVANAEQATEQHALWRERHAEDEHSETGETPRSRWQRIVGNARLPSEEEVLWAFRGEAERQISEVGAIRMHGQKYEAPSSHRRSRPYDVRIRFDLLDRSQIWIEDDDGTRHACPLYRTRSHTERRHRRRRERPQLSFSSLFESVAPSDGGDDEGEPLGSS